MFNKKSMFMKKVKYIYFTSYNHISLQLPILYIKVYEFITKAITTMHHLLLYFKEYLRIMRMCYYNVMFLTFRNSLSMFDRMVASYTLNTALKFYIYIYIHIYVSL